MGEKNFHHSSLRKGTIIYAGGFVLPDKNAAANRVVSNSKLFASLGYEVVLLGASDREDAFSGIRQVQGWDNMFEEAHPESAKEWARHLVSVSNIKEVMSFYSDVKMIILYNVPFVTLLRVKKAFAYTGIKVCYDCTEWTKDTDGSFLKRAFKAADEFFVSRFIHKAADGVIVISRMMENAYKSNSKLLLLPPLVDTRDDIWHQKIQKNQDVFEFCFAGVPDGKKESLDKVYEAFCRLKEDKARLRIVGVTKREFEKLFNISNIDNRVSFMGKIAHSEAVGYILQSDCYIFIRRSDRRNNAGFPTKFAEAFTCGVPIITTDVSDVAEYINSPEKGLLIEDEAVEKIIRAMADALNNKSEEKSHICQDFCYRTFYTECEKWLDKLL